MTISEALQRFDELYPNAFSEEEKLRWISTLDWTIKVEIIDIRKNGVSFHGYNAETDQGTKLLAEEPYDELYIFWMQAMASYHNGEMGGYNNSMAKFDELYTKFRNWYNRENMVKGTAFKYW
jgi:hypothetical protein